jgi:hypothetical protein
MIRGEVGMRVSNLDVLWKEEKEKEKEKAKRAWSLGEVWCSVHPAHDQILHRITPLITLRGFIKSILKFPQLRA